MIANGENTATSLAKTSNPLTVRHREAIADIHRKQPQFSELGFIEYVQNLVVTVFVGFPIACCHFENRIAVGVS
jgi:hypothetical protein